MVKEGIPFAATPLLIAMIFAWLHMWPFAIVFVLVAAFMIFFFRDPRRTSPDDDSLVVSAADGRVTRIEQNGDQKLVSVFLSPLDVHINRSPITGTINEIAYVKGKKMPATRDEASIINERNSLVIAGDQMTVTCTQIAGILARRIVCWPQVGDKLLRGQKFGLIKFGSRTDISMPAEVEIIVKVGDRVKGGETIIGKLITKN